MQEGDGETDAERLRRTREERVRRLRAAAAAAAEPGGLDGAVKVAGGAGDGGGVDGGERRRGRAARTVSLAERRRRVKEAQRAAREKGKVAVEEDEEAEEDGRGSGGGEDVNEQGGDQQEEEQEGEDAAEEASPTLFSQSDLRGTQARVHRLRQRARQRHMEQVAAGTASVLLSGATAAAGGPGGNGFQMLFSSMSPPPSAGGEGKPAQRRMINWSGLAVVLITCIAALCCAMSLDMQAVRQSALPHAGFPGRMLLSLADMCVGRSALVVAAVAQILHASLDAKLTARLARGDIFAIFGMLPSIYSGSSLLTGFVLWWCAVLPFLMPGFMSVRVLPGGGSGTTGDILTSTVSVLPDRDEFDSL